MESVGESRDGERTTVKGSSERNDEFGKLGAKHLNQQTKFESYLVD